MNEKFKWSDIGFLLKKKKADWQYYNLFKIGEPIPIENFASLYSN